MKVIVRVPPPLDKRHKSWRRDLTGIDSSKKDGYAFMSDHWLKSDRLEEEELGSYLLFYDEEGSQKNKEPIVRVMKVKIPPPNSSHAELEEVMRAEGWDWALELRGKVSALFFQPPEARDDHILIAISAMRKLVDEERSYVLEYLNQED